MERIDFALTPAQRADAREALRILAGSNLTLTDAARRSVVGRRALRRVTVAVARDEFIHAKLGKRARTVEFYENKLKPVVEKFGEQGMDDIEREVFHNWLRKLGVSAGTRAGIVRASRALWNWALAQAPQLAAIDVTAGLDGTGPSNQGEAEFLTVPEVADIMAAAGPYRSALALLLFGGVRPEELAGRNKPRLLWRQVRPAERIIRIPADVAKTGKPRLIEGLPEAVWHWIVPGNDRDPVSPGRTRQALDRAQTALARSWPHDATRHTFATYALAFTGDAGKVATWLGHEGNPTMLHRHYRGLATKAEADMYWALR